MDNNIFSVCLHENNGIRVWEMEDIPQPNEVNSGTAHYHGQKYVEYLLKIINQKAFMDHEERYLDPLFSIFESSMEQGVEDEGTIQWNDRCHYTRISWTGYSWKLPQDIKKRMVQIELAKVGEQETVGRIKVPLRKIAEDGGDILISSKIISKLKLKNGNPVLVRMQFCN
jgi:hypothetical protein